MINGVMVYIPYEDLFIKENWGQFPVVVEGKMSPRLPEQWIEEIVENVISREELPHNDIKMLVTTHNYGNEFHICIKFPFDFSLMLVYKVVDKILRKLAEVTEEKRIELEFIKDNLR